MWIENREKTRCSKYRAQALFRCYSNTDNDAYICYLVMDLCVIIGYIIKLTYKNECGMKFLLSRYRGKHVSVTIISF